jgi:acetolactate synthase-1/2/3 large subunit
LPRRRRRLGHPLGDIETAARFELPVVSIVLNNGVLGWNKHVISERYPDDWVSPDLNQVDYATSARALGAHAVRVADPAGL